MAASQALIPEAVGDFTPKNITITETNARHILLRNRAGLTDADAERRLSGYRDQVRAKAADFGELAKKHSEDGSAANGGVLGWMSPGQLVPEFESAMNRLQVGEVSNPVKTEFGWHLIQVLERRRLSLPSKSSVNLHGLLYVNVSLNSSIKIGSVNCAIQRLCAFLT